MSVVVVLRAMPAEVVRLGSFPPLPPPVNFDRLCVSNLLTRTCGFYISRLLVARLLLLPLILDEDVECAALLFFL